MEFQLSPNFLDKYRRRKPPFGFGALSEFVFLRTYSRPKADGKHEAWWETCARAVNGCYSMQKAWIDSHGLGWNAMKAQLSAQEMYERMWSMKFLPPGRGLWAMGSDIINKKGLNAALMNCSFISTGNLKDDPTKPFRFLMDMSALGVGVGFDCKGAGTVLVKGQSKAAPIEYKIEDSREGWVESLRLLLESFFYNTAPVKFDYSLIRLAGTPIKGFGGTAAGPEPLRLMHEELTKILAANAGSLITARTIVDIMNIIGKCIVSGNVRRSAEIALCTPDEEFLNLKNYKDNPERKDWGWSSNNSVLATVGMDYSSLVPRIVENGEPGVVWLSNLQGYSRMNNGKDNKDARAMGVNPCGEQSLESGECCNLVEIFLNRHDDLDDFMRTIKFAYLWAKTVTLSKTHWEETNRIMLRNRRIGCSLGGVQQFVVKHGIEALRTWCEEGYKTIAYYDSEYSDWLAIPKSIKTTSIKPSGTISLLVGSTPGIHWPESRFCLRRVRLAANSPLVAPLRKAGYHIEPDVTDKKNTVVVSFPVDFGEGLRSTADVSIWEQLQFVAFMQRHWADNSVSCTVSFDPKTEGKFIGPALNYYQYQLKAVSFLPRDNDSYEQMPIEPITKDQYDKLVGKLEAVSLLQLDVGESDPERFCDGQSCTVLK
jgi:hypothetical protein